VTRLGVTRHAGTLLVSRHAGKRPLGVHGAETQVNFKTDHKKIWFENEGWILRPGWLVSCEYENQPPEKANKFVTN
jgi:hypothetical protein